MLLAGVIHYQRQLTTLLFNMDAKTGRVIIVIYIIIFIIFMLIITNHRTDRIMATQYCFTENGENHYDQGDPRCQQKSV